MPKFKDITGQRFGRLIVLKLDKRGTVDFDGTAAAIVATRQSFVVLNFKAAERALVVVGETNDMGNIAAPTGKQP